MAANIMLRVPAVRFVIAHYHIFKNGGTTIESTLRREFGSGFTTVDGPEDNSILTGDDLMAFLDDRPTDSAVSSHHLRYPKPARPRTIIFDCCFLRHPLDRLVSIYDYYRRNNSPSPLCYAARRGPRDFMKWALDESPHLLNDVQVVFLANGGAFARPANELDLDRATQVLRDMAAPGLVDMFSESLAAAEYFLGPAFPGLRLHYTPQNVSRPASLRRPIREEEREEELMDLWGARIYTEVARLNQLDLELYHRAQLEIQRRLALVPDLEKRLSEFHTRCAGLSHGPGETTWEPRVAPSKPQPAAMVA